jgi:hypothetical protein
LKPNSEWRGALLLAAVLVALIGSHYAFLYRPLREELRRTRAPKSSQLPSHPELDPALVRRVGWLRVSSDRESAFFRFSPEKPRGVTRVCAFGSSFTFGAEVAGNSDYPTLLGRAFRRLGRDDVEVLNFGVGGYGFHQSYLLWEHLHERYGCDYTLVFPGRWFPERDTVFNYDPRKVPYSIHARYVLREGGLELIDPLGDSHEERFDEYYRFLPRWRYLRYDREPPLALRSLRPADSPPSNPFYYHSAGAEEEAQLTYRALLEKMAATGEAIVLGSFAEVDVATGLSVAAPNLSVIKLERHRTFPYAAAYSHQGTWGNDLVARTFLAEIVEGADSIAPVLETRDLDWASLPAAAETSRLPLAAYASVKVHLGGTAIGRFTTIDGSRRSTLAEAGTVSLLALKGPDQSIAAACFLPLDRDLADGMKVSWQTVADDSPAPLGPVRLLAPGVNIGVLNVPGLEFDQARLKLVRGTSLAGPVALLLDGEPVLRGEWNGRIRSRAELAPLHEPCRRLRATRGGWIDPTTLAPSGLLEVVLRREEAPASRAPLAAWQLVDFVLPRAPEPLPVRLRVARE